MNVRALLAAAAAIATISGCGSGGGEEPMTTPAAERVDRWTYARGLFNDMCGGCHALADAGARGRRYDLEKSGLVSILDTVQQRIALARYAILAGEEDAHGAGVAMPAWRGVLTRKEVDALARYVGTVVREPEP